jgi:NAD(P)H-dependent FMN reductase
MVAGMGEAAPNLQVIIASTRPGRVGLPVARWFHERALAHDGFQVELVDLAEWNLPFLDEPNHPRLRRYTQQHTRDWSAQIDRADAFVFVIPEYNFGFNAVIKNALDFVFEEWAYKPVGFVSYGGVAGGTRAVQMLKLVVTALNMTPLYEAVYIPFVAKLLDEERRLQPTEPLNGAADTMLAALARTEAALRTLRSR